MSELSKQPNFIVVAGRNGAGKSTTAPALLRDTLSIVHYVNTDAIALGLSGFLPDKAALPAGRAAIRQLDALSSQRVDFAFESTLSGLTLASFIRRIRSQGYRIEITFLWLPSAELAIERVRESVEPDFGGSGK